MNDHWWVVCTAELSKEGSSKLKLGGGGGGCCGGGEGGGREEQEGGEELPAPDVEPGDDRPPPAPGRLYSHVSACAAAAAPRSGLCCLGSGYTCSPRALASLVWGERESARRLLGRFKGRADPDGWGFVVRGWLVTPSRARRGDRPARRLLSALGFFAFLRELRLFLRAGSAVISGVVCVVWVVRYVTYYTYARQLFQPLFLLAAGPVPVPVQILRSFHRLSRRSRGRPRRAPLRPRDEYVHSSHREPSQNRRARAGPAVPWLGRLRGGTGARHPRRPGSDRARTN